MLAIQKENVRPSGHVLGARNLCLNRAADSSRCRVHVLALTACCILLNLLACGQRLSQAAVCLVCLTTIKPMTADKGIATTLDKLRVLVHLLLQIYELEGSELKLIKEFEKPTAFKCGTFGASSLANRRLATGNFKARCCAVHIINASYGFSVCLTVDLLWGSGQVACFTPSGYHVKQCLWRSPTWQPARLSPTREAAS